LTTEQSTRTRTELAHRSSGGIDVTLVWVHGDAGEKAVVYVCDRWAASYFEITADPSLALEVYYHPFAYRDGSTLDYEDGRFAA
jgi:hypothetical protein